MRLGILALVALAAHAQDLAGNWQGAIQAAGREFRVVTKVTRADGVHHAILYNADQAGPGVAASAFTVQGTAVKMTLPGIGATFEGKLDPDGATIAGTFTQGQSATPLILKRATPETAWAIPEPPPPRKRMAADADPVFEVATVKPGGERPGMMITIRGRNLITLNTPVSYLICFAYGIHAKQLANAPVWLDSDRYDIDAQPEGDAQPTDKHYKLMLQKLLAERFNLKFHRDKKELTVYAISPGKGPAKLTKNDSDPNGLPGLFFQGVGVLAARNATLADLAQVLQSVVLDRPVVDQSGLDGRYDFTLKWTPDEFQFSGAFRGQALGDRPDAPPDLVTAFQQQLGLKLEGTKAPAEVFVIDKVEKASAN